MLPRLIVFSDSSRVARDVLMARYEGLARRAVNGSVLFVVRDYELGAHARFCLASQMRDLSTRTGQAFGLADRADLAALLGADALHLPERGLSRRDARRIVASGTFLSRACHEPASALAIEADAVLLSPVFESRKGRPALGLTVLEGVCRKRTPSSPVVYALGGVNPDRAAQCLRAGASGVAVIGAALVDEPRPLLESLQICR